MIVGESGLEEMNKEMDSVPFQVPCLDKNGKDTLETVRIMLDDLDSISRGIRPKEMDYNSFASIRNQVKKAVKQKLKGELIHVSKMSDITWLKFLMETKSKYLPQKGKTYIKKEEKDDSSKRN